MMKYKARELFDGDTRVPSKNTPRLEGEYYNWFKNCNHKPRRWLTTFILNYLYYCEVNNLDSPDNFLLLEKANDNWINISSVPFNLSDISLVLTYLERKEIVTNQLGYQLPASKPLPLLSAIAKLANTKIF